MNLLGKQTRQIPLAERRARWRHWSGVASCAVVLWWWTGIGAHRAILAQRMDTFEGGAPRWMLVQSDCQAQLTDHNISVTLPHGGQTCELFEIDCAHGTQALMAYPIEPCAVLDEFRPRLWTRCSSGRIQLGVRVVFPAARHPVTAGRLQTILWGSSYTDTGQWQALEVTELQQRLRDETFALRQRFGGDVNLEGAFIDCLVLNAYTGQGRYSVQVDDLDLRGMIPLAAIGVPLAPDWRETWRWRYEPPPGAAERRFWARPNYPPVWLQYHDEAVPWIASLGFTGLLMNSLPSPDFVTAAKRSNLDLISPPPLQPVEFDRELMPTLKGWLLGAALDSRQASLARHRANLVAEFPAELKKPLIAEALEDYFLFSRVADEVVVPAQLSASAGTPKDKSIWLADQLKTVKQRCRGWVSINVGLTPSLERQIQYANSILNPGEPPSTIADPSGLRHETVRAVLVGAKGFVFRTSKPLDMHDTGDSAHLAALRWTNQDLRLWGPWIVAGQPIQPPMLSDPEWFTAAWSIDQSHLIIAQTQAPGSQYRVPATHDRELRFEHATPLAGQQVFRMTMGGLERDSTTPSSAGVQWTVEQPESVESFLITSNPVVMKFAKERLSQTAMQIAADQLEVASYDSSVAARVVRARTRPTANIERPEDFPPQLRALTEAQRQLERGWEALRAQNPRQALSRVSVARNTTRGILVEAHQQIVDQLASPQSSPLSVTPAAFGLHWQLADACERSEWAVLEVPGSDFTGLGSLTGWAQERRLEEKVALRVELIPRSERQTGGLRLAAYPKSGSADELEGGYAGASLQIRSADLPVRAGQLVRIAARAKVLRSSRQPGSGLLVYDNEVGPSLGQLVNGEPGESIPIELYRFVIDDSPLRLLAECRGQVDIVLETVQASVITPATNRQRYTTVPLNTMPGESVLYPVQVDND